MTKPQPEREQEPVERIELAQVLEKQSLDHDAGCADDNRGDDQRFPVADADVLKQQIGGKRAHHILRAVGEVDDVEHAEDHGKPKTQQRVE